VTRKTDPEGNILESEYDEAGNVTLEHDVTRGLRTEADYDALNRPGAKTRTRTFARNRIRDARFVERY
jgi:YD repeat-containing protein